MSKNPPIEKFRFGRVRATVWENDSERRLGDGGTVTRRFQSVNLARTIVNKDGQFQDVNNFSFSDLLAIREIIDDVISWKKAQQPTDCRQEEEPQDEELADVA